MKLLIVEFSLASYILPLFRTNYYPQRFFLKHPHSMSFLYCEKPSFKPKKKTTSRLRAFHISFFSSLGSRWDEDSELSGMGASTPRIKSALNFFMDSIWFASVAFKYLNCATFSNHPLAIFILRAFPPFRYKISTYCGVFSMISSRPSLLLGSIWLYDINIIFQ
jgi:hypothetical protein